MKELLLLRHAKSSWADPDQDDADRPLNKRGKRSAARIAAWLVEQSLRPGMVLCSSARRTRETLDLLSGALGNGIPLLIEPDLYLADPGTLLARLRRVPTDVPSVLMIGHNPGLQELALDFARGATIGQTGAREKLRQKFPTAALIRFRFSVDDWKSLSAESGTRLLSYVTPADLGGEDD